MRAGLALAALLSLVSCTPHVPEGLACRTTTDCPPEQTCVASLCHRPVGLDAHLDADLDGGADGVDAAPPDALVPMDGALDVGTDAAMRLDSGPQPLLAFDESITLGPLPSPGLGTVTAFESADLGTDGIDDFVVGGTNHAYAIRSVGPITYGAALAYATTGIAHDWLLDDADVDGDLDLWSLGEGGTGVVEYATNDGAGVFGGGSSVPNFGFEVRSLTLADVSGDHVVDILVSTGSGVHEFDRGTSSDLGIVVAMPAIATYVVPTGAMPRLLVMGTDTQYYERASSGATSQIATFPPTAVNVAGGIDAVVIDVDGDTHEDVVLLHSIVGSTEVVVLRQLPSGDLALLSRFDAGHGATDLVVVDLDDRARPEIAVSHGSGSSTDNVSVYDALTGSQRTSLATGSQRGIVSGQFDMDGRTDLACVSSDGSIHIWLNATL